MASARVKTAGETLALVAGHHDLYQLSLLNNFVSYRIAMLDKSCMRFFYRCYNQSSKEKMSKTARGSGRKVLLYKCFCKKFRG